MGHYGKLGARILRLHSFSNPQIRQGSDSPGATRGKRPQPRTVLFVFFVRPCGVEIEQTSRERDTLRSSVGRALGVTGSIPVGALAGKCLRTRPAHGFRVAHFFESVKHLGRQQVKSSRPKVGVRSYSLLQFLPKKCVEFRCPERGVGNRMCLLRWLKTNMINANENSETFDHLQ